MLSKTKSVSALDQMPPEEPLKSYKSEKYAASRILKEIESGWSVVNECRSEHGSQSEFDQDNVSYIKLGELLITIGYMKGDEQPKDRIMLFDLWKIL